MILIWGKSVLFKENLIKRQSQSIFYSKDLNWLDDKYFLQTLTILF